MAAEWNTGYHHLQIWGSGLNRHAIPLPSSPIDSTSDMIMMGNYYGVSSTAGMMFPGNSSIMNNNPGITQAANSCGLLLLDSMPGLTQDTGLTVEWSVEEQYKLEEGLVK